MVSAATARRTVSVLFCDLADSTALGERLDPEPLRELMSRWYDEMRIAVERHGGTVEKFVGDAVMAVYGLPRAHEDDALRAVRAALDMQRAVERLNASLAGRGVPELRIRIGINTGEVVTGDRASTLATGDAVNTAKRLEQAAGGGEILIGVVTESLVRHATRLEPVGSVKAKGKSAHVEAWRVSGAIAGAESFARRSDIPLVGRTSELAILRGELTASAHGPECRLVTVIGAAGVGKTRLVLELVAELGEHATVAAGRCLPYGDGITFWPLTALIRRLGGEQALADAMASEPDAALVVERLRALGGSGTASPEELSWAVRRLFEALARSRPLLVVLEDVHWAEPTLLDLVEHVSRWSRNTPILVLCVARPELLEERPEWEGVLVRLEPLSSGEATQLLDALDIGGILSSGLRTRVTEVAQGNPLYTEQLFAMLAEDARAAAELVALPPTIQALLAARLDRLDPFEREVLERAAVIGKEFWPGAVAALGRGDEALGATLLALVRREFVEPAISSFPGEDGFRFRHALIRDAAYAGIPKRTRADLHEHFAGWLELHDGRDEIVGYHLEQAYRYRDELGIVDDQVRALGERAGELLTAAGRRALARDDVPAAVNLLERGVALLPQTSDARGFALLELAIALMRSGSFAAAEGALEEALDLARSEANRQLELRSLIEREFFRIFTNAETPAEEITRIAEEAIPALEALGDDAGVAKAWHLLSEPPVNACRWGERAAALEHALEHARRAGDTREAARAAAALMQAIQLGPTRVDPAIDRANLFLRESEGDRLLTASILSSLAVLLAMRGEFSEARAQWGRAQAFWEELEMPHQRAIRAIDASTIELLAGDAEAAERELRTGYDLLVEIGDVHLRPMLGAYLAAVLVEKGNLADADALASYAESHSWEDDIVTEVMWRVARAQIQTHTGEAAEAERLARGAVDLAAPTDFLDLQATALLAFARVLREAGSPEAASVAGRAQAVYDRKGNIVGAGRAARLLA
ncbi:MAG TPA: adenylate/guanylate cyclase domain-containing protein [Gaiellaceae bacterium]|nr:adenylate/guanylate cyclase domain-containing protein [Gaiellaceae bacterium]